MQIIDAIGISTVTSGRPPRPELTSSCEISIINNLSEIARVAALVDRFAADHKLSNELVVALQVSLDEVLNNIISYAYDDQGPHDIVVRLKIKRENIEVSVSDDGKPFDPVATLTPDFTSKPRAHGGVGLYFVRNLMDDVIYTRREGINHLQLTKRLKE
ncbi:MAG: ATP-binding protein [Xanthobacteraceae bacterium]